VLAALVDESHSHSRLNKCAIKSDSSIENDITICLWCKMKDSDDDDNDGRDCGD
jgi:hypothetical protein